MINKIKTLSNDSKYTMWYCNIITNAMARNTAVVGEKHHIVPKSIWKAGAKLKSNLVMLTAKEHFICHRLLVKMLLCPINKQRMESALWLMLNSGDIAYTSIAYAVAKSNKANAMRVAWSDPKYKAEMVTKKQWFYNSEEQKEANRQKALKEMQDPETRNKFVMAGLNAGKQKRDADTKAWVTASMGSKEGRAKAKAKSQTTENREACRQRELSKTKEQRQALAKLGQLALVEKLGGEEAYRKWQSDKIKGRKKYINMETGDIRVSREPIEGYVLFTERHKDLNVYF